MTPRTPDTPRRRWRTSASTQVKARTLRREMTPAEQKLWRRLRAGQLAGAHFRRQHAVGPFVVDFFCAGAKLVIEIDGDSHVSQVDHDEARTRWLSQEKSCRVIRFTNRDVENNIEGVLEEIVRSL